MAKAKSALSLVEVLIAIAVLGGALLPIWHLHFQSARRVSLGHDQSLINNLASAFSNQVRKLDPLQLPETAGLKGIVLDASGRYHLGGAANLNKIILPAWPAETVQLSFAVKKIPAVPRENRLVKLKISWKRKDATTNEFFVPILVTHE